MPASGTQAQSFGIKSPPAYEFSKRKRWADLLLTELVDNVAFVLSPACKIWFCGTAVTETLGWRDADLLDFDFMELVDVTDQARFRGAFEEAMKNNSEFNLSIKLKGSDSPLSYPSSNSSKSAVFDIKCYPYTTTESELEVKCLIAMVAPYPSRNTAMLHTILDLKAQNDRLQRKVAEYRERASPDSPITGQSPSPQAGPMYATSSLLVHTTTKPPMSGAGPIFNRPTDHPNTYPLSSRPVGGLKGSTTDSDVGSLCVSGSSNAEDQSEEGAKKKKLKRSLNMEQHVCVTCGRTDSPEWRKGPGGPKTLCNACGLRWAKQNRKADDPLEGASSSADA
ncbi:hypothetical protein GALMADRAFT_239880 [Galerina marginata CBS 339.88]|uniref:GATA-type domain-containing protein n=1 Tax=Galerina marginata (strain CBS 339.88) TaxID=685588 RepID=A0A067TP74_GALM3|nr:hypothetical protein GALMADRAFT_239880 [Galerina marginata CBS 339.88]